MIEEPEVRRSLTAISSVGIAVDIAAGESSRRVDEVFFLRHQVLRTLRYSLAFVNVSYKITVWNRRLVAGIEDFRTAIDLALIITLQFGPTLSLSLSLYIYIYIYIYITSLRSSHTCSSLEVGANLTSTIWWILYSSVAALKVLRTTTTYGTTRLVEWLFVTSLTGRRHGFTFRLVVVAAAAVRHCGSRQAAAQDTADANRFDGSQGYCDESQVEENEVCFS